MKDVFGAEQLERNTRQIREPAKHDRPSIGSSTVKDLFNASLAGIGASEAKSPSIHTIRRPGSTCNGVEL